MVTNLCLNRLTSPAGPRETYIGPWLPEPVLTADGERAVFVLQEAFAYSHRQIAEFLDVSETNFQQLHSRARQRLGDVRPRFEPDRAQWRRLVERFLAAARGGDAAELREPRIPTSPQ